MKKEGRKEIIIRILGILLFLSIWQVLSIILGPFKLPGLVKIFESFINVIYTSKKIEIQGGGTSGIGPHLLYTARMTLLGSSLGVLFGITLGIILTWSQKFKRIFEPILKAIRTIPPLAVIPFFLMWFGPTLKGQIMMLFFYSTMMLTFNTLEAVNNVDPVYLKYAYTLGATRGRVYRTVVLPAIIPQLIGGIRVVIGVSWGIQIIAELMGSPMGLGQVFSMSIALHAIEIIIPGVIWIGLVAYIFDTIFIRIANWITRWTPNTIEIIDILK